MSRLAEEAKSSSTRGEAHYYTLQQISEIDFCGKIKAHSGMPNRKCQNILAVQMEPADGFEPPTDGLQNRCSTTELSWLKKLL